MPSAEPCHGKESHQGTIGCTPSSVHMVFIVFSRDSWALSPIKKTLYMAYIGNSGGGTLGSGYIQLFVPLQLQTQQPSPNHLRTLPVSAAIRRPCPTADMSKADGAFVTAEYSCEKEATSSNAEVNMATFSSLHLAFFFAQLPRLSALVGPWNSQKPLRVLRRPVSNVVHLDNQRPP